MYLNILQYILIMITREYILNKAKNNFDNLNYNVYKDTRDNFISMHTDIIYSIISNTNNTIKILDVVKETLTKYNRDIDINDITYRDIYQYMVKCKCLEYGIILKEDNYSDDFKGVEERMMFRIELYKTGWDIRRIERYIYKYLLKKDVTEFNVYLYTILYHNITRILNLKINSKEKKIGRPSLPLSLKVYLCNKHKENIRDEMRKKYEYSNKYDKLKNYLLTQEELNSLREELKNNDRFKSVVDKLNHLVL